VELVTEERDTLAIIAPHGDMDASTAADFQAELDRLLGRSVRYFVLDLAGVGFMDSTGLATLVRLYKHVRIGEGDVRLAAVPPQVMEVLTLTRLDRVFETSATPAEAARAMTGHD
jgi:stage II sporulation protein AA (anti-sigma F factor antagonist)